MLANFSTSFAGGSKQSLAGDFRSRPFALSHIPIAPSMMPILGSMGPQMPWGTLESSENAQGTLALREPKLPSASEQTNEQGFKNKLSFFKELAIVVYLIALLIGLLATIPLFSSRSAKIPLQ